MKQIVPMKFLLLLLLAMFLFSLTQGALGPELFVQALLGDPWAWPIFIEIRFPRPCAAILLGAGLGMAGAAMQGFTRNPLADHSLLGVSSTAALCCVIGFYWVGWSSGWLLFLTALFGSILAIGVIYSLVRYQQLNSTVLILSGVALNALAAALISLFLNLAPSPFAAFEVMRWLLGSVANVKLEDMVWFFPSTLVGLWLISYQGKHLDRLSLGIDEAQSLGTSFVKVGFFLIIGSSLIVASSVAVAGVVGFVGIIVPHLLRLYLGALPSKLLWPSAVGGALLTLFADQLVLHLSGGIPLQLGVVTGLLGAPIFLHVALRGAKQWQ